MRKTRIWVWCRNSADSLFYIGSQRISLFHGKSLNTAAQLTGTSAFIQVYIPEGSMKSYLGWTWSKLIFYQLYEREGALSEQLGTYIDFDAFELWCWGKLESPSDSKEIQPVHPKGNQSWIFIGRTDTEAPILWPPDAQEWTHLKRPWCWERLKAEREEGNKR